MDAALHSPVVASTHQELASNSRSGAAPHLSCLPGPPLTGRLSPLSDAAPTAPTPSDWRAAAAAVSAAAAATTTTAAAATTTATATAPGLSASVAKLRAGCDAALAAVRLTRATARLGEQRRTQLLRDAARHRRDVCFSHAVRSGCGTMGENNSHSGTGALMVMGYVPAPVSETTTEAIILKTIAGLP